MRRAVLGFISLLALAACGEPSVEAPAPEPAPEITPIDVVASDELPGLAASASGIDFWTHPNVAFNGLMVVAADNALVSYNIEDGVEASRIAQIQASALNIGYFGLGRAALGFAAFHDAESQSFKLYKIDNATRLFSKLGDDIPVRGNVRDACLGRAATSADPSLFIVQKGAITIVNLTADDAAGFVVSSTVELKTPDAITHCAVDYQGALLAASGDGAIYRVLGEAAFSERLAKAPVAALGALAFLPAQASEEDDPSLNGYIVALDAQTGLMHLFNSADGLSLGALKIAATDDITAVDSAGAFGASAANFGGLYRNGIVAVGVETAETGASIKLIPWNGALNALEFALGVPVSPRGQTPSEADAPVIDLDLGLGVD